MIACGENRSGGIKTFYDIAMMEIQVSSPP